MNPDLLQEALQKRAYFGKLPKAVVVVHLYGQSADIDTILKVCNQYNIPSIEDAAEVFRCYLQRAFSWNFWAYWHLLLQWQ